MCREELRPNIDKHVIKFLMKELKNFDVYECL